MDEHDRQRRRPIHQARRAREPHNGGPLYSSNVFTGDFLDLFRPYTVLAGLAVVAMFALHGATYLTLLTAGDVRQRGARTTRCPASPLS
jgi:cytochrome bd-type quinol oxidase subunit 2